ncbi:hypothetical protein LX36DRAFT_658490 [Colletotrichum falcatum]|nr:hypothetical protein LX36DRAFT_658490 [Colletotrichum falcatum]
MPIRADPCRNCGTPRCAYCPVTKVRVRMTGHHGLLETEADEEGVVPIVEGAMTIQEEVFAARETTQPSERFLDMKKEKKSPRLRLSLVCMQR